MALGKVLIVTYYWPPSGGVGVLRWLHFARNLQQLGWEPIIYTPENAQYEVLDPALAALVTEFKTVKRPIWEPLAAFQKLTRNKKKSPAQHGTVVTKSWKDRLMVWIRGNVFVPDSRVLWVKPSVTFLAKYLQRENINLIITNGPPHSMHLIGLGLKRLRPTVKWLADFRDPWSDWDFLTLFNTGPAAMKRHKKYERQVLERADAVVAPTKRLAQALEAKVGHTRTVEVITNGIAIDPDTHQTPPPAPQDKFVIGYYGMLNDLRNPTPFWNLLETLCAENEAFRNKLELRFSGVISASVQNQLSQYTHLGQKVVFLPYTPHEKIFKEYQRCHILLLLQAKTDNAQWVLPVKFFEYLSAHRAILGLGPVESDLGDIFTGQQIGEMIEPSHINAQRAFILANFQSQYPLNLEHYKALMFEYARQRKAEQMAEVLARL